MKERFFIFSMVITAVFLNLSCNNSKSNAEVIAQELIIKDSIEELSDSSFFSDVRTMSFHNQEIVFTDCQRGDLIILDEDLNLKSTVGKKGSGPGEVEVPICFYIQNDTTYIFDDVNRKFVIYKKDLFIGEYRNEKLNSLFFNFIVLNNSIYFSGNSEKHSILSINMQTNEINMFGNIFKFESRIQKHTRNRRLLMETKNYLYAVSNNLPVIERYNLKDGNFVDQVDFSHIPIINTTIQRKSSDIQAENSYCVLTNSVYSTPGNVYLLCNSSTSKVNFACNTILHFKENKSEPLELHNIYQLPGEAYMAFCMNDKNDKLYAFNSQSSRIEAFDIMP